MKEEGQEERLFPPNGFLYSFILNHVNILLIQNVFNSTYNLHSECSYPSLQLERRQLQAMLTQASF